MTSNKLNAGSQIPKMTLPLVAGGEITIGEAREDGRWTLVIVYRGRHCPLCVKYLATLQELSEKFNELGTDIVALSGDGIEKARSQVAVGDLTIPMAYGLTIEQMKALGLYISNPRSAEETDQPFPEPGLFVLRNDGAVQIIDISNAPFSRPDLASILRGIEFGKNKGYPVRGTL
ncbi:MAG: peroxiredoxin-like family protein [Sneathiella sp.]